MTYLKHNNPPTDDYVIIKRPRGHANINLTDMCERNLNVPTVDKTTAIKIFHDLINKGYRWTRDNTITTHGDLKTAITLGLVKII